MRWAFRRDHGFPWYGYYLYRRPHEFRGERCLRADFEKYAAGTDLGAGFESGLGVLSSSRPLILSDDFPEAGRPELSLLGHSQVRLDLPPGEPAFRVRVRVGFLKAEEKSLCVDFASLRPEYHTNPFTLGGAVFDVKDAGDKSLPEAAIVAGETPEGKVMSLSAAGVLEVRLPDATRVVDVDLTATKAAPAIELLDQAGKTVIRLAAGLEPGVAGTLKLRAERDFVRLRLRVPQGQILIHRLCWLVPAAGPVRISVSAYDGGMPVGTATVAGLPGQVSDATLSFDRITALEIGGGPAALIDLCAQIVTDVAFKDWQPVPDCPQPLLLPLTHPDYPPRAGPEDASAAETEALNRIVYGPPGAWAGPGFASLHKSLVALVEGGPQSRAMAAPERAARNVAGNPNPPAPGVDTPQIPSLHPLDLVLLGALHPAVAQMVGLYWADATADPESAYDYLLVGDRQNIAQGESGTLLNRISRLGWADVDAWIVFDRRVSPAPPLAPPTGVRAYVMPGGTYRQQGAAGVRDVHGNVGLDWPPPINGQGYLRPEQPVLYHVWRDPQGNGAAPQPSAQAQTLVTGRGPILDSRPVAAPTEAPQYPGDWPPFSLPAFDFGLSEGWYGYQVSAIDIFGRFSARSPYAQWRQWAPTPDPKPWYYIDPPGDRVVHPASVRVLDQVPPPPPGLVEAWALDPGDPIVVRDAALNAWRQSLIFGQRDSLIGLRVRWRWTVAQQRQAPDTREFRIYWHPGTEPPVGWDRVAAWQIRCHVVPYASNVRVEPGGDRSYEVFLPLAVGQGPFGAGVPLAPTRARPLVYANVTVTAADAAAHARDTWPGTGALAGRTGNESRAASPSRVYRVLREPPPPPEPVVDGERVYATAADWHSRSFYTFRWRPQPDLYTHVLRALDESVFAADWALRPRAPLQPVEAARFPDPVVEPTWTAAKRQRVCNALNSLNGFPKTDAGKQEALRAYRSLSDDALRVLASLPGCAKAFAQLTVKALDPADAATQDRRGPDDVIDYVPRPALRAYTDTLDGRAANRYLYRAIYVDAAQNRSSPGAVGTPVRLPDVVPPRAPAITRLQAEDRRILLAWASNREPDLFEYRVFRAESAEAALDLRTMTVVAIVGADPDPAARPAEVIWTDAGVRGRRPYWYRVVAVDRTDAVDPRGLGGNVSLPSPARMGQAFDTRVPVLATDRLSAHWSAAEGGVELAWPSADPALDCQVRRLPEWPGTALRPMAYDAQTERYRLVDRDADEFTSYRYRMAVRTDSGQEAAGKVRGTYEPL